MTRRERVKKAIEHQSADRPPYYLLFCPETAAVFQEQLGVRDIYEWVDNDVARIDIPWWEWHDLAADWSGMPPPQSRATIVGTGASYAETIAKIEKTRNETDRYILVTIYAAHWEKAYFARGIENFLADMAGEPAFARRFLTQIIDKNLVMIENILAVPGIDGVLLGSDWGTQQDLIMSPAVWHDLIRPGEQRMYDLVHGYGKDVWIHSCGNIQKLIPTLIEMGVQVLNPIQPECMDLRRLKNEYGAKLAFWGGISTQRTLPYGTPAEVQHETRRVRDFMASGGGYILAPAQHLQTDVPLANVRALLEAARETSPQAASQNGQ